MSDEDNNSGLGGVRNRLGGHYEDGVAAWIAVRILAGERAAPRWGLASDATLVALRLQTAEALDDLLVTADNGDVLAAQLKRSLTADARPGRDFAKTVAQIVGFSRAHAGAPTRARALIVVGPGSSEPIRRHLPRLLDKIRALTAGQALADLAATATAEERVLLGKLESAIAAAWPEAGEPERRSVLARTWLAVLDVDPDGTHEIAAREMLRRDVLRDPARAELAWTVLRERCGDAATLRGGLDRDALRTQLAAAGIALRPAQPTGPFISPGEFFDPLLDRARPFNHAWQLVGRDRAVADLHALVVEDEARVALVVARGGAGKSRLLRAFAEGFAARHPDRRLLFAREGIPPGGDAARDLPAAPWVLAVDDAHRRPGDVPVYLALVREGAGQGRVVLAARPHAIDALRGQLSSAGIDPHGIVEVRLDDLGQSEMRALAAQALDTGVAPELVARLAYVGRDSPLVTLVAGRLLTTGRVPLALLAREDDFRREVLDRFVDEAAGRVAAALPPDRCLNLLRLVAALGPDRLDADPLADAAAAFLGWPVDAYLEGLGVLEDAGVLLRRGRLLRVTPDVLADHLLHGACLTRAGRPTRYIERLFAHFRDADLVTTRLLANLAELDWRQRNAGAAPPDLLGAVWDGLRAELRGTGHFGRAQLLDALRPLAAVQPGPLLDLVELALADPPAGADPPLATAFGIDRGNVTRRLPPLLGDIARADPALLPHCCDLLWALGRDDPRPTNQHPEHGMRVLADLAGYTSGRPLASYAGVIDAVGRWLGAPDAHTHAQSPLDILRPLLGKVGETGWSDGRTFNWGGFLLDPAAVGPIRARVFALLVGQLARPEPAVRRRVVDLLLAALADPQPVGPGEVPDEARVAWRDDQLAILDHLARIVAEEAEPFAQLRIANGLVWHARRSRVPEVRERAAGIIASIPDTLGWRLACALGSGDRLALLEEDRPAAGWLARRAAACAGVARELAAAYPDPGTALAFLGERFRACTDWQEGTASCEVIWALARVDPDYAERLAEALLVAPDSPVAWCLAALLGPLREHDMARAIGFARRALATGDATLCAGVAAAYWQGWGAIATAEELDIPAALLVHPDRGVRAQALRVLEPLGRHLPEEAATLAMGADLGGDPNLAEVLAEQFDPELGLGLDPLSDAALEALLDGLQALPAIGGFWAARLITAMAARHPDAVVATLLRRVTRAGEEGSGEFRALPYRDDFALPGLVASPRYADLLRQLRDEILTADPLGGAELAELYAAASQHFDATGLAVLAEWIDGGDPARVAAAAWLLREAPRGFVFANGPFVERLLKAAAGAGEACYREVAGHLNASATSGVRTGAPGQPFAEDIALRERAQARLDELPAGGPAFRFYATLRDEAAANIAAAEVEGEEMDEW